MLENAWYSVISPESCSSILWRSWDYKEEAARALRLTAPDLIEQGIVDEIVPEPLGGAHRDVGATVQSMRDSILAELRGLAEVPRDELVPRRREKFRKIGAIDGRFPDLG